MKKLYILALGICIFISSYAQNYVTIPDPLLLQWFQTNLSTCMVGNQLNTQCPALPVVIGLQNQISVYSDMTGLQYLTGLQVLNLQVSDTTLSGPYPPYIKSIYVTSNSNLSHMPDGLPTTLRMMNVNDNALRALPALPEGLTYLDCGNQNNHKLTSLPALPSTLDTLIDDHNYQLSLPTLPPNLMYLSCSSNCLATLPVLPNTLLYLSISEQYNPARIQFISCPLPVLPPNLITLICAQDSLTSLPALPSSLQSLECIGNYITSLPLLPSGLTDLDIGVNKISSFPSSFPPNLIYLSCGSNPVSSFPAWPATLTSLECQQTKAPSFPAFPMGITFLNCFSDSVAVLPAFPDSSTVIYCGGKKLTNIPALPNGLLSLRCNNSAITTLPALPKGLVQLDCSVNTKLTMVPTLNDSMTLLNAGNDSSLTCLPELKKIGTLNFVGSPISCLPDYGKITTSNPPLNTVPLCDPFNSTGCQPYWNISGSVYFDQNNNCKHESTEPFIQPVKVNLYQGGTLQQQVIAAGAYSFKTDYGSYTVVVDTADLPFVVSCYTNSDTTVTVSAIDSLKYSINFETQCKPGFDIGTRGVLDTKTFFPGDTCPVFIGVGDLVKNTYGVNCNTGSLAGQIQVIISGPARYIGTLGNTPTPTSITGSTLTWNIADFELLTTDFGLNLLTNDGPIFGQQVCINVITTPTVGDFNTANNNTTACFVVRNSHDPNYKEVSPPGALTYPYNDWLTYTIHFQNTGTAAARNIHLMDTLDTNIDPSTFQLLAASVDPTVQIKGRYVTFNFPQINLPDSTTNPAGSIGYVQYRVKPMNNLMVGTNIHNTAYIYFDFNTPVATNDAANEVTVATGVKNTATNSIVSIYPNPTTTGWQLSVTKELVGAKLELYNLQGQVVFQSQISNQQSAIPATALPAGVYFIRISNGSQVQTVKVVKE